jgi:RNA 2',3'-cyclic 3'-phosphodiesterase
MKIRSFLAFELPHEIRLLLSQVSGGMQAFPLDLRWVRVENLHLTIVFLGAVDSDSLAPIEERVGEVAREHGPFKAFLRGSGVFPHRRRPNVLWVGLEGDLERMAAFRDCLQKSLLSFGIKEEKRSFKPHLTLARFKKKEEEKPLGELLSKYQDWTSPPWVFREIVLFRSDLKPSGAVYTKLNSWPLTGGK